MSLARKAASLFVVGFPSHVPPQETHALIKAGVSGGILFARNIEGAAQVAMLCRELKVEADRPFLMCVDQEGGRVARLRGGPFTHLPPMRAIGDRNDAPLAYDVGRLLAREVRAAGFDMDFAPVLDVDTNPKNPVIGDRSLSRDPEVVARLGVSLAKGMETEGVASCGKHFPGHGDTAQDSHKSLPRLPHDLKRLEEVELVPFEAYARAGLASIMTAHVVFDAVEPGVPATMSRKVLQGLLRERWGYEGVIVSDDLEMQAIPEYLGAAGAKSGWMGEAAVRSVAAGCDMVLVCSRPDWQLEAVEAVTREAEKSAAFRARVEESHARLGKLMARFALMPPADAQAGYAHLDMDAHRTLSRRLSAPSFAGGADPTERPARIG